MRHRYPLYCRDRAMSGSIEYVKVDVAVTLEMLEQLFHLVAGMDGDSFFCGFALTEFLLDGSDLCALKRLLENFLDKASDDTALESKEFANVVAEMFQVFFCQMVAPQIHRRERRHFVNRPDFGVMMEFL